MTASEFVQSIASVSPTVGELVAHGLLEEVAIEEVRALHPRKIEGEYNSDDPLIRLCSEYAFEEPMLFNLLFLTPTFTSNFVVVGMQEGDLLIIDSSTGEICIEENNLNKRWVLYYCAKDSSAFLEAFSLCVKYTYQEPPIGFDAMTRNCAEIAGGEKYLKFYRAVLYKPTYGSL